MKYSELCQKSKEELKSLLKELRIKKGRLRFDLSASNLKDYSQIAKNKKDLARILTALRNLKQD